MIRNIDLDGGEKKEVITRFWKNSDGVVLSNSRTVPRYNDYNLGTGVIHTTIIEYNQEDAMKYGMTQYKVTQYIPENKSWWKDIFSQKNKFGFVLTGNGNGTSFEMGSEGVQFKEVLDIGSLLSLIGGMRDLGAAPASKTDFMKSSKFKIAYTTIENSMKAAEKAIEEMELELPKPSIESNVAPINSKQDVVHETIPMGQGKWFYYKKNGGNHYQSGEKDSIVPGTGNDPDTNFHRTFSKPSIPKRDIPKKD